MALLTKDNSIYIKDEKKITANFLTSKHQKMFQVHSVFFFTIFRRLHGYTLKYLIEGKAIIDSSDRPKQCFTGLNKLIKVLFPEPKLNRTEHVKRS